MIAAPVERNSKAGAGFRIATIERDRAPRQCFFRALCFFEIAGLKQSARSVEGGGKPFVSSCKDRIQIDGPLKELLCEGVILRAGFTEMPQTSLIGAPGVEAARRLAQDAVLLGIGNRWGNSDRHCLSDLVLQRENVGEIAVVAFGPDVIASFGLHELRGYAD